MVDKSVQDLWTITPYGRMGATGAAQAGEPASGSSTVPARAVAALEAGDIDSLERLIRRSSKLTVSMSGQDSRRKYLLCYGGAILAESAQPGVAPFAWR